MVSCSLLLSQPGFQRAGVFLPNICLVSVLKDRRIANSKIETLRNIYLGTFYEHCLYRWHVGSTKKRGDTNSLGRPPLRPMRLEMKNPHRSTESQLNLASLEPRVGSKTSVRLLLLCLPPLAGTTDEASTTQLFSPASVTIA